MITRFWFFEWVPFIFLRNYMGAARHRAHWTDHSSAVFIPNAPHAFCILHFINPENTQKALVYICDDRGRFFHRHGRFSTVGLLMVRRGLARLCIELPRRNPVSRRNRIHAGLNDDQIFMIQSRLGELQRRFWLGFRLGVAAHTPWDDYRERSCVPPGADWGSLSHRRWHRIFCDGVFKFRENSPGWSFRYTC